MNPVSVLEKYAPNERALEVVRVHGEAVARKAGVIVECLRDQGEDVDPDFVYEAAVLHDIGVFLTASPKLFCSGEEPYIRHGMLGGEILRAEGLLLHARVAERHTGVGLTREVIVERELPLPYRDFVPESLVEQVICYADKFFSKRDVGALEEELAVDVVMEQIAKYGEEAVRVFEGWRERFEGGEKF